LKSGSQCVGGEPSIVTGLGAVMGLLGLILLIIVILALLGFFGRRVY
jgi:hypothetical protein